MTILQTGTGTTTTTANLQLTNPQSDVVATIDLATDVDPSTLSTVSDYNDYGQPLTPTAPTPYGWVGAAMRSAANQGGLIAMGARMFNPATGRFLTTDPIPGGTPNPYTYPPDPVNMHDLAGMWSIGGVIQNIVNTARKAVQWVADKAAAAVSWAVKTVSFGRINLNIPKFKIRMSSFAALDRVKLSFAWGGPKFSINLDKFETARLKDITANVDLFGPAFDVGSVTLGTVIGTTMNPVVGIGVAAGGLILGSSYGEVHNVASKQASQGGCVSFSLQGVWTSAERITCT